MEPIAVKRWTVQDYHCMSEMGILAPALETLLADRPFFVRTQDPIQLNDWSEPEPDVVIARGTVLDYADRHPRPGEIALVVEVADSTLKQDCEIKNKLYAQAEIADYWVLDLQNRQLPIFRSPTPIGYTSHLILTEPNKI